MAQKPDFFIPFNDLTQYVPQNLRNTVISGLIDNLFNRFMTHDEAVPLYGYIGRKPSSSDDRTQRVPQSTAERDLNAVIPVLNFKMGSETHAFTVQDLVNKAKALGVQSSGLDWLYSQSNNYLPPIDIDKFANFYNYYWTAKTIPTPPNTPWNNELLPEYYVISRPKNSDLSKLNVVCASTSFVVRTGTGFEDQLFNVLFTSPLTFEVQAMVPLGAYYTTVPGNQTHTFPLSPVVPGTAIEQSFSFTVTNGTTSVTLMNFRIARDPVYDQNGVYIQNEEFIAGDTFLIDTQFLSTTYTVSTVVVTPGIKGKFKNISALNEYQTIDGVQVSEGQRVLVKNNSPAVDGVYVVRPQAWVKASDYDGSNVVPGAVTWVQSGTVNGGHQFTSGPGNSWTDNGVQQSNTNDWQEGNFWIHVSELTSLGLSRSAAVQATRPIIEYSSALKLNEYVSAGVPSDVGAVKFKQNKTEFNELPMFDLFRYDGTHAGLVSSIFYYVEDLSADLDIPLQKRVKIGTSNDFVFNHGLVDLEGDLMFYKKDGSLKTIWHAGYSDVQVSSVVAPVGPNKGTVSSIVPTVSASQQVWTLEATSATSFKVFGSKLQELPTPFDVLTVGVPYSNSEFSCTVSVGAQPFVAGDSFVFRIGNIEKPRYVYRNEDDQIFDLYGGESQDLNSIGAYTVSRPFVHNPYNDARQEVSEGTLYSHFRGILQNQIPGLADDFAFGGAIKNWSEQQTLLASLLMQRDFTPISMIEMSQKQYENGLNSIADLYRQNIAQHFTSEGVVQLDGSVEQEQRLQELVQFVLTLRSSDNDVRTILYDTTSGVPGIPITLPALGITELTEPGIGFDNFLNGRFLKHHDGHTSVLVADDIIFRRSILNNQIDLEVLRSDGTRTPAVGSTTTTAPVRPYRGELWIYPNGDQSEMYAFDVQFDSQQEVDQTFVLPNTPLNGTTWFRRNEGSNGILYIWNSGTLEWVPQPSYAYLWKRVNLADTLNEVILRVEQKLYENINVNSRRVDFVPLFSDPQFVNQIKKELFAFGVKYGIDPLGSDYLSNDAFSWNYKQGVLSNFPTLDTPTVPARWYNILLAHQRTISGVIPTERPNLEPWKLLGFSSLSAWWVTLTPAEQALFTPYGTPEDLSTGSFTLGPSARVVKRTPGITVLSGLQIIDGVQLVPNDVVLIQNDAASANNGLWIVSAGVWTRHSTPLVQNVVVPVTAGSVNKNTIWALSNVVPTVNVDPILFKQIRTWTDELWAYVIVSRPGLRLSVDPTNDTLLPPYVSAVLPQSAFALTTVIPSGTTLGYEFGEGSIGETIWFRSIDFGYGLAKALFRHDPLHFLGFCWGFNWVQVDNILYDGLDVNTPGHRRFRLHGDKLPAVQRGSSAFTYTTVTSTAPVNVSFEYTGYEVLGSNRFQNFTVRDMNTGARLGYAREGTSFTVSGAGGLFSVTGVLIQDSGEHFRIGDKFNLTADVGGSNVLVTFVPSTSNIILGFGQVFTNAMRSASIDTSSSYAIKAFREWDVNTGYRAGGLISTDDLSIRTENESLSSASFELLFKKNEIAKDIWVQGLRIVVSEFGDTVPLNNASAPKTDGSNWIFRVEGYNPRYTNIKYYNLNTAGQFQTFNILDQTVTKTVWRNYSEVLSVQDDVLPKTITGIQNVLNFIFGYSKYLEEQGFLFNNDPETNIDFETGRSRTWQLEAEKFVSAMYKGIQLEQGHVLNSFMDAIWVRQDSGLLSEFKDISLFDVTANPGVFDITGAKMAAADLFVVRGNKESKISSSIPMFSVHAQLDEFEHLVMFARFVQESTKTGLLYEPFSGSRVVTYKFNARRQVSNTLRPEFGGHYLAGTTVRKNLQASTDNIANLYDANRTFESTLETQHALSLLGFNTKEYFSDLDISNKSQFNFWRGMVQSKGTNMSIQAYLNNDRFDDAKIDEYWAYKIATYGDARQNEFPEMKLQVDDSIQQFTQLQFDTLIGGDLPNFTQITRLDEDRWFSIEDLNQDTYFKAEIVGSYSNTAVSPSVVYHVGEEPGVLHLGFIADEIQISGTATVQVLNSSTVQIISAGSLFVIGYGPAAPKYNPVKLLNYVENIVIEEIPLWHPAAGQHTPIAMESLNVISNSNPAKYNVSTLVVNNNTFDPLRPWGSNEVGRTWFDTRNLEYIPYSDEILFSNRDERLSRWGTIADFSTIDVYEWVQSSVPPKEFNALAAAQAGDADLNPDTKASGEIALEETYVRNRQWNIRPVFWSYSSVPYDGEWVGTPPSGVSIGDAKIQFHTGGAVSVFADTEYPTFTSIGVQAGVGLDWRIGAWNLGAVPQRPVSEYRVTNQFTKMFVNSTNSGMSLSTAVPAAVGVHPAVNVTISSSVNTQEKHVPLVGNIVFSAVNPSGTYTPIIDADGITIAWNVSIQVKCTDLNTGNSETVELGSFVGSTGSAPLYNTTLTFIGGEVIPVRFGNLNFSLSIAVQSTGVFPSTAIQAAIVSALNSSIEVRDAVLVTLIVPNGSSPITFSDQYLSNDPDDHALPSDPNIGWNAWRVPTQAELDTDGRFPVSSFRPYVGEYVSAAGTLVQITEAVLSTDQRTLNNGTSVERYNSTWSDWEVLKNNVFRKTQVSTGVLIIDVLNNVSDTQVSVYINGISQLRASFVIDGSIITVGSIQNPVLRGSTVVIIVRHYEPSAEELAFDPDVQENFSFQKQYKNDFEYVVLPVRASDGSFANSLYYFWVKNKSTPAKNKRLSVQAITQELRDGPANFLTFQNLLPSTSTLPYRYDAITISGLSFVISKDDTFKLRFTRNFILRDDPEDLDLKDVHTEWSLIRPGQRTRIPEKLWNKLMVSVAGEDSAGNAVPSLRRVLYDERTGRSTQFGFEEEQTLAPRDLLVSSITSTIINTKLVNTSVPANSDGVYPTDFISFLDFNESDEWFSTPANSRITMTNIWNSAKPSQINEIFFAALEDILASNFTMSDLFKTSRLSAYSIKVVQPSSAKNQYE